MSEMENLDRLLYQNEDLPDWMREKIRDALSR